MSTSNTGRLRPRVKSRSCSHQIPDEPKDVHAAFTETSPAARSCGCSLTGVTGPRSPADPPCGCSALAGLVPVSGGATDLGRYVPTRLRSRTAADRSRVGSDTDSLGECRPVQLPRTAPRRDLRALPERLQPRVIARCRDRRNHPWSPASTATPQRSYGLAMIILAAFAVASLVAAMFLA